VDSVFDITGSVTACPVTAALPAIWLVDPLIGGLSEALTMHAYLLSLFVVLVV